MQQQQPSREEWEKEKGEIRIWHIRAAPPAAAALQHLGPLLLLSLPASARRGVPYLRRPLKIFLPVASAAARSPRSPFPMLACHCAGPHPAGEWEPPVLISTGCACCVCVCVLQGQSGSGLRTPVPRLRDLRAIHLWSAL